MSERARVSEAGLYHMTPLEIAWGWLPDEDEKRGGLPTARVGEPSDPRARRPTPLAALREVVLHMVAAPPCFVEFSGGRDSSLVLSVALEVARREGLPEPVAVTQRFPGIDEADERDWQEEVARHLGVTEWIVQEVTDQADLIGPVAAASLRRHGVIWPPLAHTRGLVLSLARGGTLVTGEGGDEVFASGRLAPLHRLGPAAAALVKGPLMRGPMVRGPLMREPLVKEIALALAPFSLRRSVLGRRAGAGLGLSWLRTEPRSALLDALARESAHAPLDHRRAIRRHLRRRCVRIGMATLDTLAAHEGIVSAHPLLAPPFLSALAAASGAAGFAGRTEAMRALFRGVLPDAVLARSTKAYFGAVAFNHHARTFAESWDGTGIDAELVDGEELAHLWRGPEPPAMTYALLQACWLAKDRAPAIHRAQATIRARGTKSAQATHCAPALGT